MKVYIASKSKHAAKWRALRAEGFPISCTWIDQAGAGETLDWSDLWHRCIAEAREADAFILFTEEGETLQGALVELGAALAGEAVFVFWVGPGSGSIHRHPHVQPASSVRSAFVRIGL